MSRSESSFSQGWPEVNEATTPALSGLIVVQGHLTGTVFYLTSEVTAIGGALDNDVVLEERRVAPYHAGIRRHTASGTAKYYLYDLGSPQGVRVNGVEIVLRHQLQPGDRITIGTAILEFFMPR